MKKLFLTLGLLGIIPFIVFSTEKIVTVTTLTNNPPFTFSKLNYKKKTTKVIPPGSDSQRLQGYSWDVLRESFHEMGYTVKLYIVPWARAFIRVKN